MFSEKLGGIILCRREDLNLHGFLHTVLSRACIPISTLRQKWKVLVYQPACRQAGSNTEAGSDSSELASSTIEIIPECQIRKVSVGPAGLEPATNRLRGDRSTN